MSMEKKDKKWTMWMRPKGTFGIGHLLQETREGIDFTLCGMEYDTNAEKQTGEMAERLACTDCEYEQYSDSDVRVARLGKFFSQKQNLTIEVKNKSKHQTRSYQEE